MPLIMKRLPDSELDVMETIWKAKEPVTSAYVCENLKNKKQWKVTSVLTFLKRLTKKGFLSCSREGKSNLYIPLIKEEEYLQKESRSFLERLCGNSLTTFVTCLYNGKTISDEDLKELRESIDKMTGGK